MNEIVKIFNDQPVRIMDNNGEPWFVAKDVCNILDLTNPTEALRSLDEDERSSLRITEGTSVGGGNPNVNIISESGLYKLVMRSRKAAAQPFVKWVTRDVLPGIRKNGAYVHPNADTQGFSNAVIKALEARISPVIEENFYMRLRIKYLKNFEPEGNFGDISPITGKAKTEYRRGCLVSGCGKPYQKLLEGCKQQLEIPGLFDQPLPSAPVH